LIEKRPSNKNNTYVVETKQHAAKVDGKPGGRPRILRGKRIFRAVLREPRRPWEWIGEKKFVFQHAVIQPKLNLQEKKVKKNFGVSENGCIFAPAFDRGARP